MSKIIKKVIFLLVLAGLLSWGVATMANGPSPGVNSVGDNVIVRQGEVLENSQEVSRDQVRHF